MPNANIPKFVRNQIDLRTEANLRLLNGNPTPSIHNFNNGNSGWIRMTSGVDIVDADLARTLGVSTGNQLAKNKILQSGELAIDADGKYKMRAALGNQGGAYGDEANGNREYGIRPMAGIKSLSVDGIANNGATRNATVVIQCWTKKELDALLLLYARLGHSVLIEWGWSQYFNNPKDGNIKSYQFDKLESKINYYNILDNNLPQEQIYRDIFDYTLDDPSREAKKNENLYTDGYRPRKLMEVHSGNYEAFFGLVKNFTWRELKNNGYEITTVVMGMGGFLDSVKTEYVSKVDPAKFLNITSITPAQKLDFFVGKMNGTLSEIYNRAKESADASKEIFNNFYLKLSTLKELSLRTSQGIAGNQIPVVTARALANNTSNFECYIRFEELVQIINQYMITSVNNNAPMVKLSLQDAIYEDNECLSHYLQLSGDISVCLIKQCESESLCPKSMRYSYFDKSTVQADDVNFFVKGNKKYNRGLIKNIFLNINYLKKVITTIKTSEGTYLYDFIMTILKDVQASLGDINSFELRADPFSNVVRIYDSSAILNDMTTNEYESTYKFELKGGVTAVRDCVLESTIDSKTANAVVIATRGLQLGETGVDNANVAILNFGTQDRHVRVTGEKVPSTNISYEKINFLENAKLYTEAILKYVYSTKMIGLERNSLTITNVNEALKKLIQQEITLNKNNFVAGSDYYAMRTVPIRITLTLSGVGGLNVGQKFRISDDKLPIGYGFSYAKTHQHCFMITNVAHRIEGNDWVTEVQGTTSFIPTKDVGNIGSNKIFENTSLGDVNSTDYKNLMASYLT